LLPSRLDAILEADEQTVKDLLSSVHVFARHEGAIQTIRPTSEATQVFMAQSVSRLGFTARRILHHLQKQTEIQLLEIGAAPYFLTALLLIQHPSWKVTSVALPPCTWPGEPYEIQKRDLMLQVCEKSFFLQEWIFNAEKDNFPWPNNSFDAVICTEVIEHLIGGPAHLLHECNRVLKDNGLLFLSTPNALNWTRPIALCFDWQRGLWDVDSPYSLNGPYDRHNRLFSQRELTFLLEGNHFRLVESRVVHWDWALGRWQQKSIRLLRLLNMILRCLPMRFVRTRAGNGLFVVGVKTGDAVRFHPPELYKHAGKKKVPNS